MVDHWNTWAPPLPPRENKQLFLQDTINFNTEGYSQRSLKESQLRIKMLAKKQTRLRVGSPLRLFLRKDVLHCIVFSSVETTYVHRCQHLALSTKFCHLNSYKVAFPYCLICISLYHRMWESLLSVLAFWLSSSIFCPFTILLRDSWVLLCWLTGVPSQSSSSRSSSSK